MMTLDEIEWNGTETSITISGAGVKPLLHLTEVIDHTIDDEYNDEPTSLYMLNLAMRGLLENLDSRIMRFFNENEQGLKRIETEATE